MGEAEMKYDVVLSLRDQSIIDEGTDLRWRRLANMALCISLLFWLFKE